MMKSLKLWTIATAAASFGIALCTSNPADVAGVMSEEETGMFGELVDERTSQPAANVSVELYLYDSTRLAAPPDPADSGQTPIAATATNLEGAYAFSGLPAGRYDLYALLIDGQDTLYAFRPDITYARDSLDLGVDTLRLPGSAGGVVRVEGMTPKGIMAYIPGTSYSAITDSAGVFLISNIPQGKYEIAFMHSRLFDTAAPDVSVLSRDTTWIDTVHMTRNPAFFRARITGTVFDDGGQPVDGAAVLLRPGGASTESDPSGAFTIGDILAGKAVLVASLPPLYTTAVSESLTIALSDTIDSLQITLHRNPASFPSSIRGLVVNELGEPIVGARITALDSSRLTVLSNTAGAYLLSPLLPGAYDLDIRHEYHDSAFIHSIIVGIDDTVLAGIDTLKRNPAFFPGKLSGKVVDETGQGTGGVHVTLSPGGFTSTTNDSGRFEMLGVLAGDYRIRAEHDFYEPALDSITIAMADRRDRISLSVTRRPNFFRSVILGTVYTADSLPLPDASVTLDSGYTTATDSLGAFALVDVLEGEHAIRVVHRWYQAAVIRLNADLDQEVNAAPVYLAPRPEFFPGAIQGMVYDPAGNPVENALVSISNAGRYDRTDSEGAFTISAVTPGSWELAINHSDYEPQTLPNVAVAMNDTTSNIGITLAPLAQSPRFAGSIAGTVVSPSGEGVAGAIVTANTFGPSVISDSTGAFVLAGLVAGKYELAYSHARYYSRKSVQIALAIGQHRTGIEDTLTPRPEAFPGAIAGAVLQSDNTPVAGATIVTDPGGLLGTSAADGSFFIAGLTPGTYDLRATAPRRLPSQPYPVTVTMADTTRGVALALERDPEHFTGAIRGVVIDSLTRKALPDIRLELSPRGITATTDSDGQFHMSHVPFGTYMIAPTLTHYASEPVEASVIADKTVHLDTIEALPVDVFRKRIEGAVIGNHTQVSAVTATITGEGIGSENPVIEKINWYPVSGKYAGFVDLPRSGAQWQASIRLYDIHNRLIGFTRHDFDRIPAVVIPPFNAGNALPAADLGADTLAGIGDTIRLHATIVDSFSQAGPRAEPTRTDDMTFFWSIGEAPFTPTQSIDTMIILPSAPEPNYACRLRAVDSDSNRVETEKRIETVDDMPTLTLTISPERVSVNDSIRLAISAADGNGRITELALALGDTDHFSVVREATAAFDTVVRAPAVPGDFKYRVRATDDDGNRIEKTGRIAVVRDIPAVSALTTSDTVDREQPIHLWAVAKQEFGRIVSWGWDFGLTGTFSKQDSSEAMLLAPVPQAAFSPYAMAVRAVDDDGNPGHDTVRVILRNKRFADSLALVALKISLSISDLTWNTALPLENWSNITLQNNRVAEIDFYYKYFSGAIPPEVGALDALERLKLKDCLISGVIPPEIGNLTELRELDLSANNLEGALPETLGNLHNCEKIDLSANRLSGPLPQTIGNCVNLWSLSLRQNSFSGSIPASIGNLTSLVELWLNDNQLAGPVPPSIGNCGNLNVLWVQRNALDFLPDEISLLSPADLNLAYNSFCDLSAAVESWLNAYSSSVIDYQRCPANEGDSLALVSLREHFVGEETTTNWHEGEPLENWTGINTERGRVISIDVSGREFGGTLPAEIGALGRLRELDISGNALTGTVPATLGNCNQLERLFVNDNAFSGDIPDMFSSLRALIWADFQNNQFSGIAASAFGNLENLKGLRLSGNALAVIPDELGACPSLETLELSNNHLSAIPASFGNLEALQTLRLEGNLLETLPDEVGTLSCVFYCENNRFQQIPAALIHENTAALLFSDNQLTALPVAMGAMTGLVSLWVNGNELTALPDDIGSLNLNSLNIAGNRLSHIPQSIVALGNLSFLDLGDNALCSLSAEQRTWADSEDPDWESAQRCTGEQN